MSNALLMSSNESSTRLSASTAAVRSDSRHRSAVSVEWNLRYADSVFRFYFFSSGVIKAVFKADDCIDWLKSCVKNGVSSLPHAFSNHVGIGSRKHCSLGHSRSTWGTSSTVVTANFESSAVDVREMLGGLAAVVDALIASTLWSKKRCKIVCLEGWVNFVFFFTWYSLYWLPQTPWIAAIGLNLSRPITKSLFVNVFLWSLWGDSHFARLESGCPSLNKDSGRCISCFFLRHSLSNVWSDIFTRHVVVAIGACLSRSDVRMLLYVVTRSNGSDAKWSKELHNTDVRSSDRKASM